jgi:hypothetical protein
VFGDVAADRAPEVRALQTGVPEVKAGQGARQFDVPDGVAKAITGVADRSVACPAGARPMTNASTISGRIRILLK